MSTLTRLTPLAVLLIVVVALVAPDPGPTAAAGKLSLWRLKTYIPPAHKLPRAHTPEGAAYAGLYVRAATLPNRRARSDMSDVVGAVTKELGPILANAEGAVKFGGKYYAVPHYGVPLVLFYRKDILEKIGAEPPDTWEAIQQISQKVKQAGIHDFPNGFPWNRTGDGYDPAMSLLWSYGAAWVDKSGKFTGIPKGPAVQALRVVTSAYLVDKTAAFDYLSWSGSTNNESFMAGKITFTPNGPSILFQEESNKHPLQKDTAIKLMTKGPAGRTLALHLD